MIERGRVKIKTLILIVLVVFAAGAAFASLFGCSENDKKYTLRYGAGYGGRIEGEEQQVVKDGECGTAVKAIAENGYIFAEWSDGVKSAWRTDVAKSDVEVTATFKVRYYNLNYSNSNGGEIVGDAHQTLLYGETGSTVTAVAKEGYEFTGWSDGVKTSERRDTANIGDIDATATFRKKRYIITYKTFSIWYGMLCEEGSETETATVKKGVAHGDSFTVIAKPKTNISGVEYVFVGWSDGVTTAERTDTNISDDITVTAYFGYEIDYKVYNNVGGRIEGNATQKLLPDEPSAKVTAVPDDGYVFCGWSNFSTEPSREGDVLDDIRGQLRLTWECFAYFEPIEKTFTYDYGEGVTPLEKQITLNRNAIKSARFAVPTRAGYDFCGWYADSEYNTRITDGNGMYMYGYAAFSLDSDTLYARWQKHGENCDSHKILLVFVDEIDKVLYSKRADKDIRVQTKMTPLSRILCKWIRDELKEILCDLLKDIVSVEVDAYYTTDTVNYESAFARTSESNSNSYHIFAKDVQETVALTYGYHNTVTYIDYGRNKRDLFNIGGIADIKHSCVYLYDSDNNNTISSHYGIDKIMDGRTNYTVVGTTLHELIHTAETGLVEDEYGLHAAMDFLRDREPVIEKIYKPFLLGEFMLNGVVTGIPIEYWKHQVKVDINYVPTSVDMYPTPAGKVIAISELDDDVHDLAYVVGKVNYGSSVTVQAVPYGGYRFVKWTDGVTTAVRTDKNIISFLSVYAIFEKIT